jgi:hypothetical protein
VEAFPEAELAELADALCDLMEDVQLDAKQHKFIWPGSIAAPGIFAPSCGLPRSWSA